MGLFDKILGVGQSITGTDKFKASSIDFNKKAFEEKLAGQGTQEELRKKQAEQAARLEQQATGKAPSIADAQLKAASDKGLAQQIALAKASRGGNAASRERMLAKGAGAASRDVAQQAAIAKLQERQAAEQALANQLQAQRQQDIGVSEADRASLQALEKLRAEQNLGIQGINLSGQQSAASSRGGLFSGGMAAIAKSDINSKKNIKKEESDSDFAKRWSEGKSKQDKDNKDLIIAHNKKQVEKTKELKEDSKKSESNSLSAFAEAMSKNKRQSDGVGASMASKMASQISDENCKVEIEVENEKEKNMNNEDFNPKSFLDALQAYSYEYKNSHKKSDKGGEGRYLSVMAQDLEKAGPVGRSMVEETPNGKQVNYGKGFGAILAAQAHLNQRLSELEKNKK